MKLTKGISHTINLGNYESLKLTAEVTVDSETDFYETVPSDKEILAYVDALLEASLHDEIHEARSLTALNDSYVHDYEQKRTK